MPIQHSVKVIRPDIAAVTPEQLQHAGIAQADGTDCTDLKEPRFPCKASDAACMDPAKAD